MVAFQGAHGDAGFVEQGHGNVVDGVSGVVDDFGDSGVDDHFGAQQAGAEGGVEGGSLDGNPVIGGLDDGIFLGMAAEALMEIGAGGCV